MFLKPFFNYYGGKWKSAKHYPWPRHQTIVEPFAGAAGYSLQYPKFDVTLYDSNPVICGVWDYLIRTPAKEILAIPLKFAHVDELKICQEARWLIGFWVNTGVSSPRCIPSQWMRLGTKAGAFWGEQVRLRLSQQVEHIRHWKITNDTYHNIPNEEATWFVDPPYNSAAGQYYKHWFVNYLYLADWCRERWGQVMVCEQEGADWLPFKTFRTIITMASKSGKGTSNEVIWEQGT